MEIPQAGLRRHRPALSPNYLTQDGVVPRSKLPGDDASSSREVQPAKYGLRIPNVFHAGDGNLHPLILYDEREVPTRCAARFGSPATKS